MLLDRALKLLLSRGREFYYINGPDTLPPPLSQEGGGRAARTHRGRPVGARSTLVEHNLRLVVYIARKFENTGIGIEDLISIGTIGLIKAINTFKPDKNIKLTTYASRCIENEIFDVYSQSVNQRSELSIDEPLNTDWDGNKLLLSDVIGIDADSVSRGIEDDEERRTVSAAVARLDERDRRIIMLRFGIGRGGASAHKRRWQTYSVSHSRISRGWRRKLLPSSSRL